MTYIIIEMDIFCGTPFCAPNLLLFTFIVLFVNKRRGLQWIQN